MKKLTLNKETIASLTDQEALNLKGGTNRESYETRCKLWPYTCYTGCVATCGCVPSESTCC